ncbi:hypothetical protein EDS67_22160 [candidate division KSB1 bacterium]|nr:MAG: hypothetical protein EDS67_22160 [candidate division KSB1 bacterium]MBC6952044.1 hypothetical protein [candidate division KSB1 bacterium]MCE7944317.1 hypothetical protein [Chlorobi bacterium CHB1]MDL1878721.1 hypothetical protein [Cytophagia bacterium CHB2]RIK58958.1 MAG: hypothetical protein DCC62_29125 [candidate division KSB1 bacterium]
MVKAIAELEFGDYSARHRCICCGQPMQLIRDNGFARLSCPEFICGYREHESYVIPLDWMVRALEILAEYQMMLRSLQGIAAH